MLDFRRVTGMDGIAWELLAGLAARARDHGVRLIASHRERSPVAIETAPTTDEALERWEEDLLRRALGDRGDPAVPLADQPLLAELPPGAVAALADGGLPSSSPPARSSSARATRRTRSTSSSSGRVSAQLGRPGERRVQRLQGMGPGTAFGERPVRRAPPVGRRRRRGAGDPSGASLSRRCPRSRRPTPA